jgi:hypothetical protein
MATNLPNVPIPQDKIGESFVWRDWFQRLGNRVFGSMSAQNTNAVFITGGTVDNTVVGSVTPAAGTFTALTGTFTGGSINNTPIGATTPSTIKGTTVQASTVAGFKSSDGSTGYTGTITTASLVGKTVTIKDGIITNIA